MKITKKQRENLITIAIGVTPIIIMALENAPAMNEVLKYWLLQIGAIIAFILRVLFVQVDKTAKKTANRTKSSNTNEHVCTSSCPNPCPYKRGAIRPPNSGGR